jgi:hypothetical protein
MVLPRMLWDLPSVFKPKRTRYTRFNQPYSNDYLLLSCCVHAKNKVIRFVPTFTHHFY